MMDMKLRKRLIAAILCIIPVVLISGMIVHMFKTDFTYQDFILRIRFEFFYNPLFIFLLGIRSESSDWEKIRRYEHRRELASHEIISLLFYALLFSLFVFLPGCIIYIFFLKHALLSVISILLFALIFFLMITFIGLLFLILELMLNRITASLLMISLVIIDRFTSGIIPHAFYSKLNIQPFVIFSLLFVTILLTYIIQKLMKGKDFYGKDVNE
jgi:hypothetical protein